MGQLSVIAWQLNRRARIAAGAAAEGRDVDLRLLDGDELTRHLAHLGA